VVLGCIHYRHNQRCAYKAVTFFGRPFQNVLLRWLWTIWELYLSVVYIPLPPYHNAHRLSHDIGLGSSPFAHHYLGNHFVFFSWRYLDVSVHAVHLLTLWIQIRMIWVYQTGFPHSEIFGSMLDWQLPEAYGSLPPLSSSLDTKASTKKPLLINHKFVLVTLLF
jgi:hypothetical protein